MAEGVLRRRRVALEREWAQWVPQRRTHGGPATWATGVRCDVAESWGRSLNTVDPERGSAPASGDGDFRTRWSASLLRQPVAELADELCGIADAGFVAAVTDESGTILWSHGGRVMRRRAERVNFAPGGRWGEPDMGTNALALALRNGAPSMVFSAEHLVAALHDWVCYCAPVRDPAGRTLGVLDVSTVWDRSHPLAMTTVRNLVSRVEASLRANARGGQRPAPATVRLTCLGAPKVVRDGVPLLVRPRQLEILTLLALEPAGFGPQRLREALYGDRPVTVTTVKAEVSHLRAALGGGVANRRYALTAPISCDATEVLGALRRGDVASALRWYAGPLLPESDAPGIVEWRDHIEVAMRAAVLASAWPEHALSYGEHAPYDVEAHEHALRTLRPSDARRAIAAGRLVAARRA